MATKPKSARRAGARPLLTGEEMLLISRLSAQGKPARTIARMLSRPDATDPDTGEPIPGRQLSPLTVAEWLRRAKQPAEDLQMALASLRIQAVTNWAQAMQRGARDGRHAPAKDLLIATGVIDDRRADRVVILIGTGAADVATLPALPSRPALPAVVDAF